MGTQGKRLLEELCRRDFDNSCTSLGLNVENSTQMNQCIGFMLDIIKTTWEKVDLIIRVGG
jgi:hypothetical protein